MNTRLRKLWDNLRSSYWFLPAVMMALSLLLWMFTSHIDTVLSIREKKAIAWLYIGGEETMRTLLLSIAIVIMGVLGVVFTIIMVPLSIAAAQFGPRLLRTFLRDTGTQITLGIFTSTFIFCMAVLLQLSGIGKDIHPQISVNVALLYGLISFGVLIYFINHISVSLQAPVVVYRVSRELHRAIARELPETVSSRHLQESKDLAEAVNSESPHTTIFSKTSGYLQARDDEGLMIFAQEQNVILRLLRSPGDFVVAGNPLAEIFPAVTQDHSTEIQQAFITGVQRTLVQDINFGIKELVEVALRALSPAINDPFTAMTCLDWIGSALSDVCKRTFPAGVLYDSNGNARLLRYPVTFEILANTAFNQIREYGRGSTSVTLRLLHTIGEIGLAAQTPEQRNTLLHHAMLTEKDFQMGLHDLSDQQKIMEKLGEVKKILKKNDLFLR